MVSSVVGFYSLRFFGDFIPKKDDTTMTKVRWSLGDGASLCLPSQPERFIWESPCAGASCAAEAFVNWKALGWELSCALCGLDGVHSLVNAEEPSLLAGTEALKRRFSSKENAPLMSHLGCADCPSGSSFEIWRTSVATSSGDKVFQIWIIKARRKRPIQKHFAIWGWFDFLQYVLGFGIAQAVAQWLLLCKMFPPAEMRGNCRSCGLLLCY